MTHIAFSSLPLREWRLFHDGGTPERGLSDFLSPLRKAGDCRTVRGGAILGIIGEFDEFHGPPHCVVVQFLLNHAFGAEKVGRGAGLGLKLIENFLRFSRDVVWFRRAICTFASSRSTLLEHQIGDSVAMEAKDRECMVETEGCCPPIAASCPNKGTGGSRTP
jgi:hypothetical protein